MTVASATAERLIGNATGVALDILFKTANDFTNLAAAPSSELVLTRWSKLPAHAAYAVASVITDTDLIDKLAAKEKRKTVRVHLARNRHTHPVTRMYFYQEGLRLGDYEIRRAAARAMSVNEVLDMLGSQSNIVNDIDSSDFAEQLVAANDQNLVARFQQAVSENEFRYMAQKMLARDAKVALDLFDAIGYEIGMMRTIGRYESFNIDSIETYQRLIKSSNEDFRKGIIDRFGDEPEKLAKIDPELLEEINDVKLHVTTAVAEVFIEHNRIAALLRCHKRSIFQAEAVDALLAATDDPGLRVLLVLRHPEPRQVVGVVGEPDAFVSAAVGVDAPLVPWILENASSIGHEYGLQLLDSLARIKNDFVINNSTLSNLSSQFKVNVDLLLTSMSDALFMKVASFPDLQEPRKVFERAKRLGVHRAVADALVVSCTLDVKLAEECIDLLMEAEQHATIRHWLRHQPFEMVEGIIVKHHDRLTEYLRADKDLHRSEWAPKLITSFAPASGWSTVRQTHLVNAALQYLQDEIGDDARVWETSLSLYDTWTGSLEELVFAARTF